MGRLKERVQELQPSRMQYAKEKITAIGAEIKRETICELEFMFKGYTILLFPYTGWYTGKGIKDGRGIHNLLKQMNLLNQRNNENTQI